MIAGKEKLAAVEKHHVTTCMAWSWNGKKILIKLNSLFSIQDDFGSQPSGAVIRMHYSAGAKFVRKSLVISNIIAMRQEHLIHAAQHL